MPNFGWGRYGWGTGSWGYDGIQVDITGLGVAAAVGAPSATGGAAATPTGRQLFCSDGAVTVSTEVNTGVTGLQTTASIGAPTASGGAAATPTGLGASLAQGAVIASIAIDASVTGRTMFLNLGVMAPVQEVDVELTGEYFFALRGTPSVKGDALTAVSGFGLAVDRGDVIASIAIEAPLTGNGLTFSTGRMRGPTIWAGTGTGSDEAWASNQPPFRPLTWQDVVPPAAA